MASIVMDVLTNIDERSAALGARKLEDQFKKSGAEAGESFGASLAAGMMGGFGKADFSSVTGILSSGVMTARAATAGNTLGAAYAAGIAGAAAVGIVGAAIKIGSAFEDINRQITLGTSASGGALEDLKSHADALVGSLDTSTKSLGNDMAVLAQRLHMEAGGALDQLTEHVEMLRDRFGQLNVQNLSAALVQFKVPAGEADNALASLTDSARGAGENVGQLIDSMAKAGDTLSETGMTIEQSGRVMAQATEILGSPDKAVASFGMAMKAAAKEGESLEQFMPRVMASIQAYEQAGNKAAADAIANDVFGARKAVDAKRLVDDYMEVWRAGPAVYRANGAELTELEKKTATLENRWQQVRNKIEAALAPTALTVVDLVADKMDDFVHWIDQHKDDLANMFTTAVDVIENTLTLLGEIASVLAKHPALVQAIAVAFATWKVGETVLGVVNGLKAVSVALGLLPAEAATAGSGMIAALGPVAAFLAGIALSLQQLFSWANGPPDLTRLPPGAVPNLPNVPGGGPKPGTVPGGSPTVGGIPIPGLMPGPGGFPKPPAPPAPPEPAPPPPPPGAPAAPGAPGEVPGGLLTPGDLEGGGGGKGRKGAKGPRLPGEPEVPYGPGYGAPPAPGESPDAYRKQQDILEKRHAVAEAQARLNQLEADNNATADDVQKARNKLAQAESQLYESEETQLQKHTDALDEFGVKLDKDFGVSKGLAGIADNLVKFVAALAMAPAMGKLSALAQASGASGQSGRGLIGMAAAGGAFGPAYMPGAVTYPGNPTSAAEFGVAGNRVGALYALAESMVGTPYSTQLRNDCSGMVSKLANAALGLPPQASFSTANEGQWLQEHGFQPGIGPPGSSFQVGWSQGGPGGGHTAATLPGGVNAEQGGGTSGGFTLGPGAAGGADRQFGNHAWLPMGGGYPGYGYPMGGYPPMGYPGYAQGGEVMIRAHEGEHVFDAGDVTAMGGQDEVYKFRAGLHSFDEGGDVLGSGPYVSNEQWQKQFGPFGPGTPGGTAGSPGGTGPGGPGGGGPGDTGATTIGGTDPPHGFGSGLPGGGNSAAGQAGASALGGVPPPGGMGGGASAVGGGLASGAASGAATMGIGIAAQIAMQEAQRAIQQVGTYAGIGVSALQQTFSMGGTKLSQGSWVNKIAGGLMGAQPQLPNVAGQHEGGSTPAGGPSPESALPAGPTATPPGPTYGDINSGPTINVVHNGDLTEDAMGRDIARQNTAANAPPTGPNFR